MAGTNITISEYIVLRLVELGVSHAFGVPGDYNLNFLDYIEESPGMEWVGNCNELNAAYCADGYARIRGLSLLVTTGGVGELSALNGLAGSYAEDVPLVHIVGMPSQTIQQQKLPNHHTFADGDYDKFIRMQKPVSAVSEVLNISDPCQQIDDIFLTCLRLQKPVVLGIAVDLFELKVNTPTTSLESPLELIYNDRIMEQSQVVVERLNNAKAPLIIVDGKCRNHGMIFALRELVAEKGFAVAVTLMAKGMIDEDTPGFIGTYFGKYSSEELLNYISASDCILWCGYFDTDLNSGGYTTLRYSQSIIKLNFDTLTIGNTNYKTNAFQLISAIKARLLPCKITVTQLAKTLQNQPTNKNTQLSQECFWDWVGRAIKPDSTIVVEAGTSIFGLINVTLPKNVKVITQLLWGSIGYSLGATVGALAAGNTQNVYLFIGDGSFQLTAQEVSTMLRHGYKPVIFLINNNGYTIERYIHGAARHYNDIACWDYCKLVESFAGNCLTWRIKSVVELESLSVELAKYSNALRFIEVCFDQEDAPQIMHTMFDHS